MVSIVFIKKLKLKHLIIKEYFFSVEKNSDNFVTVKSSKQMCMRAYTHTHARTRMLTNPLYAI
jgi:hypothetical protein